MKLVKIFTLAATLGFSLCNFCQAAELTPPKQQTKNIDLPRADGRCPIHNAVLSNNLESVKILIGKGASVFTLTSRSKATPLAIALNMQKTTLQNESVEKKQIIEEIIKLLIEEEKKQSSQQTTSSTQPSLDLFSTSRLAKLSQSHILNQSIIDTSEPKSMLSSTNEPTGLIAKPSFIEVNTLIEKLKSFENDFINALENNVSNAYALLDGCYNKNATLTGLTIEQIKIGDSNLLDYVINKIISEEKILLDVVYRSIVVYLVKRIGLQPSEKTINLIQQNGFSCKNKELINLIVIACPKLFNQQ